MPGNHLIVGLGGTGGRVIREMRKTIATLNGKLNDAKFAYLYVDSDPAYMKPNHPEWRIVGRNVGLSTGEWVPIGGADVRPYVDNPAGHAKFRKMLGDPLSMKRFLDSQVDIHAGAQRRRYGRLLFANKAGDFKDALVRKSQELQSPGRQAGMVVHICAGLAGGTGSGAIVDAVAMVRKYIATGAGQHRVILYLVLPEETTSWDKGMYHANGYAALVELNAMAVGRYDPSNPCEEGRPYGVPDPFNCAFLINKVNSAGRISDVGTSLPQIISDFILHRAISAATDELVSIEKTENVPWTPELSVDPEDPVRERTKKWALFGIERLTVPRQETDEYMTYSVARAQTAQLLTANWRDGVGFVPDRRIVDFAQHVRDSANLDSWHLSDRHITLSLPILPGDGRNAAGTSIIWSDFAATWATAAEGIKARVVANAAVAKDSRQSALWGELEKIAQSGFRMEGIGNFFALKSQAIPQMAKHVQQQVEKYLIDQWRGGSIGLVDADALLKQVIVFVEAKMQTAPGKASEFDAAAEKSRAAVTDLITTYSGMSFPMRALNATKFLENTQQQLVAHYTQKSFAEGWRFAANLMRALLRELNATLTTLSGLTAQINQAAEEFEKNIASRLRADDPNSHAMRLFDKDGIDRLREGLATDRATQAAGAEMLRRTLGLEEQGKNSFAAIALQFDPVSLRDALEAQAAATAHDWLNNLSAEDKGSAVGNIVDRLAREYGANPDGLTAFCRQVCLKAAPYGHFNVAEENLAGAGVSVGKKAQSALFWIPAADASQSFRMTLCEALENAADATVEKLKPIEGGVPGNEIVIATIANVFPLRFVQEVAMLKVKYETAIREDPGRKYFAWTEDDGLAEQCPIFVPDGGVSPRTASTQYALMALALGVVKQRDANFSSECFIEFNDANGLPQRTVVAAAGNDLLYRMKAAELASVRKGVDARLAKILSQTPAERESILEGVKAIVMKRLQDELSGDTENPDYRRLSQAMTLARTNLLKLG